MVIVVDFGIFGKILHIFRIGNRSRSSDNNAYQKREISSVLPVEPKSSQQQQKLQQEQIFRRAFIWTIIWISLVAVFAAVIYFAMGYEKTLLFVTGYAIEKSLSVDNMFVFLIIFSSLAIPYAYQHKVLMVGIVSAIITRIALILAGVSLLESFHWMIYFLLAGMIEKFYYLKPGLAMILFFVGSNMLVSEFYEIPIAMSLLVIFGILAAALPTYTNL